MVNLNYLNNRLAKACLLICGGLLAVRCASSTNTRTAATDVLARTADYIGDKTHITPHINRKMEKVVGLQKPHAIYLMGLVKRVSDSQEQPVADEPVALYHAKSERPLQTTHTNAAGQFRLELYRTSNNDDARYFIQVRNKIHWLSVPAETTFDIQIII